MLVGLYTELENSDNNDFEIIDLKSSRESGYVIMKKNGIAIYVYCFDPEDKKLKLLRVLPMSPYLDGEYESLVINGGLYGNFLVTRKYYGEKPLVVHDLSDVKNPSIREYHCEKNNRISCMCVSKKFVVAGNWDGEISIWALKTGKPKTDEVKTEKPKKENCRIIKIPDHNTQVYAVRVSQNEECLFIGLNHKSTDTHSLDIMDFNGKRLHRLEHVDTIHSIIECPKRKRLIIGGLTGFIYIWDLSNMKCLFRSKEGLSLKNLHYDPDTSRIFGRFYQGIVKIWDIITGKCLQRIPAYEKDYLSNCPMCILKNGYLVMGVNDRLVFFEENKIDNINFDNEYYNLRKINDNLKDDDIKNDNTYHKKSKEYYRDILRNYYCVQEEGYDWSNFFHDYPDAMNTDFLIKNLKKLDDLAWSYISNNLDLNKVDLEKFQKYLNWKDISAFHQLSKKIILENKD